MLSDFEKSVSTRDFIIFRDILPLIRLSRSPPSFTLIITENKCSSFVIRKSLLLISVNSRMKLFSPFLPHESYATFVTKLLEFPRRKVQISQPLKVISLLNISISWPLSRLRGENESFRRVLCSQAYHKCIKEHIHEEIQICLMLENFQVSLHLWCLRKNFTCEYAKKLDDGKEVSTKNEFSSLSNVSVQHANYLTWNDVDIYLGWDRRTRIV